MDVEGAEIGILENASASDLASCGQLTVEFHDKRAPFTRRDVDRVCRRMRAEGYGIVMAKLASVDDVLFVNLKSVPTTKRIAVRCRIAISGMHVHRPANHLRERLFVKWVCEYGTSS